MTKIFVAAVAFSLVSFTAKADCKSQVESQLIEYFEDQGYEELDFDGLNKISKEEAVEQTHNEGLLWGKQLESALTKINTADQVFLLWTSHGGGSATELVTVSDSCKLEDVIRIQEE